MSDTMHAPGFVIQSNGDTAWDICFDDEVSKALSTLIIGIETHLEHEMGGAEWPEVIELIPAYCCLTVRYNPLQSPPEDQQPLKERLERLVGEFVHANDKVRAPTPPSSATTVEIPVCYEGDYAPDMNELCETVGLTRDEVIRRHSAPCYLVHMLGFTPGFLYLGGLDPRLTCPRKPKPTLKLAAGSVGIGGNQTGVYPQETPGGWQIIGRTPIQLFDPARDAPFIARPLDRIQFVPISPAEFEALAMAQEKGLIGKTPPC